MHRVSLYLAKPFQPTQTLSAYLFSYFSTKTYVGSHKNRINEMALLSTQNKACKKFRRLKSIQEQLIGKRGPVNLLNWH